MTRQRVFHENLHAEQMFSNLGAEKKILREVEKLVAVVLSGLARQPSFPFFGMGSVRISHTCEASLLRGLEDIKKLPLGIVARHLLNESVD